MSTERDLSRLQIVERADALMVALDRDRRRPGETFVQFMRRVSTIAAEAADAAMVRVPLRNPDGSEAGGVGYDPELATGVALHILPDGSIEFSPMPRPADPALPEEPHD